MAAETPAAGSPFPAAGQAPPPGVPGEGRPGGGTQADAIDLFAGPGGWDTAAAALGLERVLGVELDAAACQTRAAAGHKTIRADVSQLSAGFARNATGVIGSPPCTIWSAAGKRAGVAITGELATLTRDAFAGLKTRAAHRRVMARVLRQSQWLGDIPAPHPLASDGDLMAYIWRRDNQAAWKQKLLARRGSRAALRRHMMTAPPGPHLRRAERSARIWSAVRSATLVAEPARFIAASRPEWVALEQVPAVLPLWRVYAAELRALGYSVWTGKLNAADYGVPQTRERAILIASRVRKVCRPEPTHYDPRKGDQLWGERWVSMAGALGWGATVRPVPTVTGGGVALGGWEPFARGGREALDREQEAGRWTLHTNRGQAEDGSRQIRDPRSAPALTSKSGGQWVLRTSFGKPAAGLKNTGTGSHGSHEMDPFERPAHAVTTKAKDWAAWVAERPATTVQGDPRVGRPGHKDRDKGESQFAQDSVRITVEEAAALQSFPPGYPWRGTKSKQFEQVGNAIPPLLAMHVLAMAAGAHLREVAA